MNRKFFKLFSKICSTLMVAVLLISNLGVTTAHASTDEITTYEVDGITYTAIKKTTPNGYDVTVIGGNETVTASYDINTKKLSLNGSDIDESYNLSNNNIITNDNLILPFATYVSPTTYDQMKAEYWYYYIQNGAHMMYLCGNSSTSVFVETSTDSTGKEYVTDFLTHMETVNYNYLVLLAYGNFMVLGTIVSLIVASAGVGAIIAAIVAIPSLVDGAPSAIALYFGWQNLKTTYNQLYNYISGGGGILSLPSEMQ